MTSNIKTSAAIAAIVIALAAPLVTYYEGYVPRTYADPINLNTICYGHTGPDVVPGRVSSMEECQALLSGDLRDAYAAVDQCVNAPVKVHEAAAMVSFAYNVGGRAFCGSTLVRLFNAGAPPSVWCHQLKRWNKARVLGVMVELSGLTKRRQSEYNMCMGQDWRPE